MKNVQVYRSSGAVDIKHIDRVEEKIGFRFPEKYKKLISLHNYLVPESSDFRFFRDGDVEERDLSFYGFGDGNDSASRSSQMGEQLFEKEKLPHGVIPFGDSGNGDYVCFDYRHDSKTTEPHVVAMLHDAYDPNGEMSTYYVANSFEEFVDSLYKYEG
jgi:cell wall assembly regulator SMI1